MNEKKNEERRIAMRVPAVFDVNFIHAGDYLISSTRDISADGMFLHTDNPPAIAEKTKLSFSLDKLSEIEVDAEVVWVNKSEESKDHGMAVKFINPSPKAQEAILEIINKVAVFSD